MRLLRPYFTSARMESYPVSSGSKPERMASAVIRLGLPVLTPTRPRFGISTSSHVWAYFRVELPERDNQTVEPGSLSPSMARYSRKRR